MFLCNVMSLSPCSPKYPYFFFLKAETVHRVPGAFLFAIMIKWINSLNLISPIFRTLRKSFACYGIEDILSIALIRFP